LIRLINTPILETSASKAFTTSSKLASERILFKAGYLVLLAGDGEEALRLARESVPDLVLLDLLLPGIGGEEVLHTLKRDPHTKQIPGDCRQPSSANQFRPVEGGRSGGLSSSLEDDERAAVFLGTIKRVLRESQGRNEVETHRPLVARQ
jgi:DNA-binding NarL/FixJ family response regulator